MKQGAKIVIEDWNRGKLKYFTVPPSMSTVESSMMMEEEPMEKMEGMHEMDEGNGMKDI